MGQTKGLYEAFFQSLEVDLASHITKRPEIAFGIARQRERAKKRALLGDSSLSQKAVGDFISLNRSVGDIAVELPDSVSSNARMFIRAILERYSSAASELNIQVPLDRTHLLDLWRFGPGASFDTEGTHAADKIGQAWSTTSTAATEVLRLRRNHPYLCARDSMEGVPLIKLVRGSKLSTVQKNEEKDRTIAIEPVGNMCLQLAAGEYLSGALRMIGLDINHQQPLNKAMAREGSITGLLATIDLKSASDMIKPELVQLLLPPEWYELLMAIRSPETLLPNGEWLTLNMISTMGNGFTFPLMTLLIVALIYGFRCESKGSPNLWIDWKTTCVFGDDVIIPTHEFSGFCQILQASGLVVNHDKSYFEGPFRESCGGDFYEGFDVTPFYVKSLESSADIYVALNKMSEWSGRMNVFLPRATELLFRQLGHEPYFVPEWEQPTAGFRCTQVSQRYKRLTPVPYTRKLKDEFFLMSLACAGYVSTDVGHQKSIKIPSQKRKDQEVLYMPRPRKTRYRVTKSRLPKGYLDGRDPVNRDSSVSSHCDFVAWFGSAVFLKAAGS